MKVTKIQDYEDGGATLELELSREELLFLAEHGLQLIVAGQVGLLENYTKMKECLKMYADAGYNNAKKVLEKYGEI